MLRRRMAELKWKTYLYLGITEEERNDTQDPLISRHLVRVLEEKNKSRKIKAENPERIVQHALELGEVIKEKQDTIYEFVKTQRPNVNEGYKRRYRSLVLQYNLGEWVMISSENTHRKRMKLKLKWQGSFQITEIVSPNIYKVTSLTGKEFTVHALRMWWYNGSLFEPPAELVEHFKRDYGALVVDDSWEPLETLVEVVPNLVRKYLLDITGKKKLKEDAYKVVTGILQEGRTRRINLHAMDNSRRTPSEEYTKLKMDPAQAAEHNFARYGSRFYKKKERLWSKARSLCNRWFHLCRFTRPKPIRRKEDIVYFRRMDTPELRSEKLAHLKSVASKKELSRVYPTIRWKELEHEIYRITALVEKDDMLEQVIEELDIVFKAKTRLWQSKVWKQENFKIPEHLHFDGQRFAVTLDGENNRISLAGDSPLRGPAITYPQLDFDEIPLKKLISTVKNGYVFLWAIHNVEQQVLKLFEYNDWRIVETITWIKMSRNGKVSSSIGPYFNRGKETCLMIQVGNKSRLQTQSNFGVDVIMEPRRDQSRKPQKLYEMIENAFTTDARFVEYFGRPWNCRERWITIGLELAQRFSLHTEYEAEILDAFKET
eukprot:augustus_masked-scaffold_7-processed-gene-0.44-mRNA-1 protein AED:0.88 eAED:1.00 QI:0/0/0/0.2/1/1/5/0/600